MNINSAKGKKISDSPTFGRMYLYIIIFLSLFPIFFTIITSLKSTEEFFTNIFGLPHKVVWNNYPTAWIDGSIGRYFGTSLQVVSVAVVAIILFGSMAGYALAKMKIPHEDLIIFSLLALNMLPSESVIMPLYIMLAKLHMTGKLISLMLPYTSWGLPFTIYIFKNFFSSIPTELSEAARIDGCTETRLFFKVIMPLMLPPVATTAIISFTGWWGELLWASVALSASRIATIPLGILAFQGQFATDWGRLSAAICIVLIPLIIIFFMFQKYFIQGLTSGAVKG
jgi:raffinose/stachyose/melibiose transport system permease protein